MQKGEAEALQLNRKRSGMLSSGIKPEFSRELLLFPLIMGAGFLHLVVIVLPVFSIIRGLGFNNVIQALSNPQVLTAMKISLLTTGLTLLITFLLGTPVAFLLKDCKTSILARIFEIIVSIPTVLPPAVAGIALLFAFGRNGSAGALLAEFNIEMVFTPAAVVLAQFFVSSGFYIQVLKTGVDSVSPEIFEASYIFGAGKIETFIRIIIPMVKKPIMAGLVLSWTRALGEFGATIMFAGNVAGRTRTMPLEIYTLLQTDITAAAAVSMVLLVISFIMLFTVKIWIRE